MREEREKIENNYFVLFNFSKFAGGHFFCVFLRVLLGNDFEVGKLHGLDQVFR